MWWLLIVKAVFVVVASLLAASLLASVVFLSIDRYFIRKYEFLTTVVSLKKGSKNE